MHCKLNIFLVGTLKGKNKVLTNTNSGIHQTTSSSCCQTSLSIEGFIPAHVDTKLLEEGDYMTPNSLFATADKPFVVGDQREQNVVHESNANEEFGESRPPANDLDEIKEELLVYQMLAQRLKPQRPQMLIRKRVEKFRYRNKLLSTPLTLRNSRMRILMKQPQFSA